MIYQEPDEVAARCTSALREQGIHKGDRVISQTDITRILSWWGQTPGERIQPGKNIAIFNLSYFYHPGFGTM